MQILNLSHDKLSIETALAQCVRHLKDGKLVAIPTETVYGLGGDAANGMAVAKIFETKLRPQFNPLIAHVSGLAMARTIGLFDPVSLELARQFWPGPLTLVVARHPQSGVHDLVSAQLDTIAIRCPGGIGQKLIEAHGAPLAAPSANRSGKVSPTDAAHVASEFEGEDIIIVDGGPCELGIESTIAQVNHDEIRILRAGSITREELSTATKLAVTEFVSDARILAPGMMASHYAPRSQVALNCTNAPENSAALSFGARNLSGQYDKQAHRNLSASGDLREAASNLYRHIRELDAMGKSEICVAPIPLEGLGLAINDRLIRAGAPRPKNLHGGFAQTANSDPHHKSAMS